MPSCTVHCCSNHNRKTKGTDIKYFSFPKDENLRKIWIKLCKRNDKFNVDTATICSEHFSEDAYKIPLQQKLLSYTPKHSRNLKKDAIPTKKLQFSASFPTKIRLKAKGSPNRSKRKGNKNLVQVKKETEFEDIRTQLLNDVVIKEEEMDEYTEGNDESEDTFTIDQFDFNLANVETETMPENISEHNSMILKMNTKIKRLEDEKNELKSSCEQLQRDNEALLEEVKTLKATVSSNMHVLICTPEQTRLLKVNQQNGTSPLVYL